MIKTTSNHAAWARSEGEAELLELILDGRLGQAGDIAQAAVWLASDASDYMTGTTLYVDGGMRLYPSPEVESKLTERLPLTSEEKLP